MGQYFELSARGSTFWTELRAGLVMFLTVAYILAVNSQIISDTGGTCSDADCTTPSPGCRFNPLDQGFQDCKQVCRCRCVCVCVCGTTGRGAALAVCVGGGEPGSGPQLCPLLCRGCCGGGGCPACTVDAAPY